MPCMGSLNTCPMDVVSTPWYAKPTEEGTRFFPTAIWLLNSALSALCASWANMHTVSRLLFECVVGVWSGLGSVYVSSQWLSVSGWVELILADVCVCVCVCWCDKSMHPFIIYVILYLHYRFLCSTTHLYSYKHKCFGIPLHVLKLMSHILVKLNCPVRDD